MAAALTKALTKAAEKSGENLADAAKAGGPAAISSRSLRETGSRKQGDEEESQAAAWARSVQQTGSGRGGRTARPAVWDLSAPWWIGRAAAVVIARFATID